MASVLAFLVANKVLLLSILYVVVNELSAFIPGLKNNGLIGLLLGALRSLGGADPAAKP